MSNLSLYLRLSKKIGISNVYQRVGFLKLFVEVFNNHNLSAVRKYLAGRGHEILLQVFLYSSNYFLDFLILWSS